MAGIDVMPDDGVNTATVNSKMTAIANAIREKTGESGTLTLDAMAAAIEALETGGGYAVERGSITFDTNTALFPESLTLKDGVLPSILLVYLPSTFKSENVTNARTIGSSIVILQDTVFTGSNKRHAGVTAATLAYSSTNVHMPSFKNSAYVSAYGGIRMCDIDYTIATSGMTYDYLLVWGVSVPSEG